MPLLIGWAAVILTGGVTYRFFVAPGTDLIANSSLKVLGGVAALGAGYIAAKAFKVI